ncbi:DUF4214 domain-containing protein [Adhaeretor mobilis]|nr:DUF4214 domain-containing protein [Adhaeretor mobilis]
MDPEKAWVIQEAEYQLALGSDTFKFMLRPYKNKYAGTDVHTEEGPPHSEPVHSLVDRAKNVESFRKILDMPFRYTMIWAFPVAGLNNDQTGIYTGKAAGINLGDGYSKAEAKVEYRELYDFTRYLIEKYQNTGRSFLIGNWEGDWVLLADQEHLPQNKGKENKRAFEPSQEKIEAMRAWFANRQKAIEDARNSLPDAKGVHVYHYVEVNHFENAMDDIPDNGDARLVNAVLPNIKVDAVSYSAWNGTNQTKELPGRLHKHLQFIEDHAQFTGEWPFEKAVFVGEYGRKKGAETTKCINAAASWGCPFTLYWCIIPNYPTNNHYMVEKDGSLTESYMAHHEALAKIVCQRDVYRLFLGKNPTEKELNVLLANFQNTEVSSVLAAAINSPEFVARISDSDFVAALLVQLLVDQGESKQLLGTFLNKITTGELSRFQVLLELMDSDEFKTAVNDREFSAWICTRVLNNEDPASRESVLSSLSSTARSQVWKSALNSPGFGSAILKARFQNTQADYKDWIYENSTSDTVYQHFSVDFRGILK